MIERHWTGVVKKEKAEEYIVFLRNEIFPHLHDLDGFLSAKILTMELKDGIEFLVISQWRKIENVKAFAGEDISVAVITDKAKEMMIRFDKSARHYELQI
jgi:heme-degrading monooxygenase HmoA